MVWERDSEREGFLISEDFAHRTGPACVAANPRRQTGLPFGDTVCCIVTRWRTWALGVALPAGINTVYYHLAERHEVEACPLMKGAWEFGGRTSTRRAAALLLPTAWNRQLFWQLG